MARSMRELFSRKIPGDVISLRHSLDNHVGGIGIGLRQALREFDRLNTDSGFEAGCRRAGSIEIGVNLPFIDFELLEGGRNVGHVLPAWVPADRRDARDLPRTLEGVLVKSKITFEDFPLKPWHSFYDWNFHVEVDPQYRHLLNEVTRAHHTKAIFGDVTPRDIIECEWDTAFLPLFAIPPVDARVWMTGRWIFDCGHPEGGSHRMEIHPPKAIVSFRSEAANFEGNSGPTRANNAIVYIGRKGGYIDQPINDQDYSFDLHLPPKPHPDARPAQPVVDFVLGPHIQPRAVPIPEADPRLLRVTIPLKGVLPHPVEYGAVIAAGWTDPAGTEVKKIRRFRITMEKVTAIRPSPPQPGIPGNIWLFFFGVNGRWHRTDLERPQTNLNVTTELTLHQDDPIHVTACGFARRGIFAFMGKESGVSPSVVGRPNTIEQAKEAAGRIRDAFVGAGLFGAGIPTSEGNHPIHLFSRKHKPVKPDSFMDDSTEFLGPKEEKSKGNNFILEYTIAEV